MRACVCVEIYNRKSATVKKQCCAKRAASARPTLSLSLCLSLCVSVSVGFAAVACRGEPAAAAAMGQVVLLPQTGQRFNVLYGAQISPFGILVARFVA